MVAARQAFNEARYDDAQLGLHRLLTDYPNDPAISQARFLLLQDDVYLGVLDEAEALLVQLQQESTGELRDDLLFWGAEIARHRGQNANARAGYQQLIATQPQSALVPLARYSLGLAWYEDGHFTEALDAFRQTAEQAPTTDLRSDARLMTGMTHYRLRQYPDAVQTLRALLGDVPQYRQAAAVHYYAGDSYYYLNEWPLARQEYTAALSAEPQGKLAPYACYGLGWTLYQLKRPQEAQAALERFVRERPDDPLADSARYAAGQCALQQHDVAAAARWFDEIIAHANAQPESSQAWLDEAWLGQGDILTSRGDRAGAIAVYQEALRRLRNPRDTTIIHQRLGELLTHEARFDEAQREWTLAAEAASDPAEQSWAWLRAGDAAQERGRWVEAHTAYRRALAGKMRSDYVTYAEFQQATLLRRSQQPSDAIAALQAFLATHPQSDYADHAVAELAEAYAQTDRPQEAATQWQTLITQYPRSQLVPQAYDAWGMLLMDQRQWLEAAERFRSLVRFFPNDALAPQAVLLRAQCLQLLNRADDAQTAVREHLARPLAPDAAIPLWIWLGQTAAQGSRWEEARAAFQTVMARWPHDIRTAQAFHELALVAKETGHLQEAETLWRRVVDEWANTPWATHARIQLAELALQPGGVAAAQAWLTPIFEAKTARLEDRITMGDFWRRHSLWSLAQVAYAPRAGDAPADAARLLWLRASCHEEAGQTDAAKAAYGELDHRFPESPWAAQARLALGHLLEHQEQWAAARRLYQQLIAEHPDEAQYAKERLEALDTHRMMRP